MMRRRGRRRGGRSQWTMALVPLIVPLPVMLLGLFISAIQALIFATLASFYIGEGLHEAH